MIKFLYQTYFVGEYMGAEQLQGIPWHSEQIHKTCKTGSKYCLYNSDNTCMCTSSIYYHNSCAGKGDCEEFESRGNTAKSMSEKTIIIKQNPHNSRQPTEDMFSRPSLITKHYTSYISENKKTEAKPSIMNSSMQDIKSNNKSTVLNDKHIKFIENAETRVNDIIVKIEKLENLSDKNRYEYTSEEIEKMFSSIEEAVKTAKQSFINKNRTRFKF